MKKIIRLMKKSFHDVFLFKKRFILSVLGILIACLIINVSFLSINYSAKESNFEYLEYPRNTGVYFGKNINNFKDLISYEQESLYLTQIDNTAMDGQKVNIYLYGVDENFLSYPILEIEGNGILSYTKLIYGEEMTKLDLIEGNRYIYLEEAYCDVLFQNKNPIGQNVTVLGNNYIVKGVLESTLATKRALASSSSSSEISVAGFIPRTILENEIPSTMMSHFYIFIYDSSLDIPELNVKSSCVTYEMADKKIESARKEKTGSLFIVYLVTIVAMSVLELIIIIFNLKERTSEIGIKRAIGATKDDICFEFVLEQIIIGVIGILLGVGMTLVIAYMMSWNFYSSTYIFTEFISVWEMILSSGFMLIVIILSSLIPVLYVVNTNIVDVVKGE